MQNTAKQTTGKTYGYCRISRKEQSIDRQIRNITAIYPDADIRQEAYTGRKMEGRAELERLLKEVAAGDTIVFDSVSRMSRNAEDGTRLYFELFNRRINLVFLNEQHINSAVYQRSAGDAKITLSVETGRESTDKLLHGLADLLSQFMSDLAKEQIRLAFEQSQKEVDDLRTRTEQGIETARRSGKQIGQKKGAALDIKKADPVKYWIKKLSKDFEGTHKDDEVIALLALKTFEKPMRNGKTEKVSCKTCRNTYYKYKAELEAELNG